MRSTFPLAENQPARNSVKLTAIAAPRNAAGGKSKKPLAPNNRTAPIPIADSISGIYMEDVRQTNTSP
ncbi:MAG: hypothetical protein R3C17_12640 [Planctomycetaceae bacterium]